MAERPRLAIVLTGGGARAAYQAGVLHAVGKLCPELRVPIITGTSAGGINAVQLANHPGPLSSAVEELADLWRAVRFEDVFRTDAPTLSRNASRWLLRLSTAGRLGGGVRGLLDTSPLRRFLQRALHTTDRIAGIGHNLDAGHLRAVSLTTLNYATGQTVTWVEGRDVEPWIRPQRVARLTRLRIDHVMASAALPLIFPAVNIAGSWYGDGGVRLTAPLSPALHLGADRILAISTRYPRSPGEAEEPEILDYPPPAQITGKLLNAMFLDLLDRDVRHLERINRLLRKLPAAEHEGMRPVDALLIRPSQDLGRLVARFESKLPKGLRYLTRGLGTRQTKSPDFLSLLMFQRDYVEALLEIGERDATARRRDVERWVEGAC
ncbi:MAG: patatin [Acidobacteria bacterium]|nr:MAG: patatin [Acidobacteriota bacterium]